MPKKLILRESFHQFIFYMTAVFLSLLSIKWISAGFEFLIFSNKEGEPRDLLAHWTEQTYVNNGINPYRLAAPTLDLPQSNIGAAHFPWMRSFISGGLLYSPDWPLVRYHYALIQALSLLVIAWFVWGFLKGYGFRSRLILVLSATACSSIFTNLWVGQLAIILVAALFLVLKFGKVHFSISGILLGFSLIKPTLTAYFFPAVVFFGGWKIALIALLYIVAATIDVLARTQTGMFEWMALVLDSGEELSSSGYSLIHVFSPVLNAIGITDAKVILLLVLLVVSVVSLLLMYYNRNTSLLLLFSIASVAGRLATYHRAYDNYIIVFLMIALGALAFKHSRKYIWFGFALVCLSLWGPVRLNNNELYNFFQLVSWIIGLSILIVAHHEFEQGSRQLEDYSVETPSEGV